MHLTRCVHRPSIIKSEVYGVSRRCVSTYDRESIMNASNLFNLENIAHQHKRSDRTALFVPKRCNTHSALPKLRSSSIAASFWPMFPRIPYSCFPSLPTLRICNQPHVTDTSYTTYSHTTSMCLLLSVIAEPDTIYNSQGFQ